MILNLLLAIGIFASLMMFMGDMLLYFTTEDYQPDGTLDPVISIMIKISDRRLILGGLLGPIASFFYCIGFYHITYIVVSEDQHIFSLVTMLICSLGMIISGAYHSHCTYLGLIAKSSNKEAMEKVCKYIKLISSLSFFFLGTGLLLLAGLILSGKTIYPRWFFLLTPLILYFLKFFWKKIRQPFLIILFGGWYNLMFSIYFLLALLLNI